MRFLLGRTIQTFHIKFVGLQSIIVWSEMYFDIEKVIVLNLFPFFMKGIGGDSILGKYLGDR